MRKPTFLWRSDKPAFHAIPAWLRLALKIVAVAYLGLCAALWAKQREMLFHPMPAGSAPGSDLVRQGGAQFWITKAAPTAPGTALVCAPNAQGRRGAVAYFGGNAEPASSFGARMAKLPGCDAYALDYPGYEGAEGSPSEESIHKAADAMMARMRADGVDMDNAILFGRSLGSGEAARQASLGPCAMAALATPYDSISEVASERLAWAPVALLIRDPFDAKAWAAKARCPALVLFAEPDSTIPSHHAFELSKAWSKSQGARNSGNSRATHDNILDLDGTWRAIRETYHEIKDPIPAKPDSQPDSKKEAAPPASPDKSPSA